MSRRILPLCIASVSLATVSPVFAAYFHEAHRKDVLELSDFDLKSHFVVNPQPSTATLSPADAETIAKASTASGLFEQEDALRSGIARCGEDDAQALRCKRQQEAPKIVAAHGAVSRSGNRLTLKVESSTTLALEDWEKCASKGECDGERFIYLGPLDPSNYYAVEIDYEHDSPSLILFQAKSGKMALVHYGSEPTFLNRSGTLLLNYEDMNDATSLLVTNMAGDTPTIDLQCLGTRSAEKSFSISFKGWSTNDSFELVVSERRSSADTKAVDVPVRLTRDSSGTWTIASTVPREAAGFACRQRGGLPRAKGGN